MKSAGKPSNLVFARLAPFLRVSAFGVVVASLVVALAHRQARAQLDDAMLGLGSRMMAFPTGSMPESRTVQINGVSLYFRTQLVESPLRDVVEHYRGVCEGAGDQGGAYGALIASLATRSSSNDVEGYVACVDTGAGDFETLAMRFAEFSKTWDLADVGLPRYAYVRRAIDRPETARFVLTMWTDGALDLRDLVPLGERDVKGSDPANIPRPPGFLRILSAREDVAPSRVYVYSGPRRSAVELGVFYRKELSRRGWTIFDPESREVNEAGAIRIFSAANAGRTLTVLADSGERGEMLVTLLVVEGA